MTEEQQPSVQERSYESLVADKDFKKVNKKLKGIIHIHFLLKTGV